MNHRDGAKKIPKIDTESHRGSRQLSLDAIGLRYGIKHASDKKDFLRQNQEIIASYRGDITDVVLIFGDGAVGGANTYAEYLPNATIHLLSVHSLDGKRGKLAGNVAYAHCPTISDRISYLARHARPQLIIEDGNNHRKQKLACFRELSYFLPSQGIYVIEELKAAAISKLSDGGGENIVELLHRLNLVRHGLVEAAESDDANLAGSISSITFGVNAACVRMSRDHLFKLRDSAANEVLTARFGSSWGEVVTVKPAERYASLGRVINYGSGPIKDRNIVKVPERYLRRYNRAICQTRQRALYSGYFLPDTFRHPLQSRLSHRAMVKASSYMDRSTREPIKTSGLDGSYFYFDTEYPGHFGHVMTEVVGRYWGWKIARQIDPSVRPLVSVDANNDRIPEFQRLLFDALDVPTDELTYITPRRAVEVEALFAATPGFAMPQYAAPELAGVWKQISARLSQSGSSVYPQLIFSSRRPRKIRTCLNALEVEDFFASLGFEVVYPEDYSLADQVRMFSGARVVAGFGGSNMFCTMFAPGVTKIVISGEGYTANNEQLIAGVVGGNVHNIWGRSEVTHPRGGWTWAAFQSNFYVPLSEHASSIRSLVDR